MGSVEVIIGQLNGLSDSELDIVKKQITEIKRSRTQYDIKDKHYRKIVRLREQNKDKMIKFNPFLKGKI